MDSLTLLDLDGTFINSYNLIATGLMNAMNSLGHPIPRKLVRPDIAWEDLAEEREIPLPDLYQAYKKYKIKTKEGLEKGHIVMFDDTIKTLDYLSKISDLAVITRGQEKDQRLKIDWFDLGKYFKSIQVTPWNKRKFPNKIPQALDAIRENGVVKKIYVAGDSETDDIQTATQLKAHIDMPVYAILVDRNQAKKSGADYIISEFGGLVNIVGH